VSRRFEKRVATIMGMRSCQGKARAHSCFVWDSVQRANMARRKNAMKTGKIDFRKSLKPLYNPPAGTFVSIEVPRLRFVKIDGAGDPNTAPAYRAAIEWLYGVSYGMKFAAKTVLGKDYVVPPLEGLWWADDPGSFIRRQKDQWRWTMMIMVPDFIAGEMFDNAVAKTGGKLGQSPQSLRLESCDEGSSLQTLHVGGYDEEGPVLARLHNEVMPGKGVTFNGPHHEIYLSDPRKTESARLKTILRQPVKPGD